MPKNVFGNIYIHRSYQALLDEVDAELVESAKKYLPDEFDWNLIKVSRDRRSVTFSQYRDFDADPHPELVAWVKVEMPGGQVKRGNGSPNNPLILHRKETFVSEAHPQYAQFAALTAAEEQAGLYAPEHLRFIGRKNYWENLLTQKGLRIENHELKPISSGSSLEMSGKTAIHRTAPSVTARLLVKKGLLARNVFDWGCGYGTDIEFYRQSGLDADGYDPNHRCERKPADFEAGRFSTVTCTYVLNTLYEPERIAVLNEIFDFLPTGGTLFLTVRTAKELNQQMNSDWTPEQDGWLTPKKTFQKGFSIDDIYKLVEKSRFDPANISLIKQEPLIVKLTK